MEKDDRLILSKLHIPYIRPRLVPRPQLQTQNQGRNPRAINAGNCPGRVWQNHPGGIQPGRLWNTGCLVVPGQGRQPGRTVPEIPDAALNAADNRIGNEAGQLMAGMGQVPPETILTSLVNDLDTHNQEIVLVLDDYHLITSQAVHDMVGFLLEHLPE